jgi:hypothetical protein
MQLPGEPAPSGGHFRLLSTVDRLFLMVVISWDIEPERSINT